MMGKLLRKDAIGRQASNNAVSVFRAEPGLRFSASNAFKDAEKRRCFLQFDEFRDWNPARRNFISTEFDFQSDTSSLGDGIRLDKFERICDSSFADSAN